MTATEAVPRVLALVAALGMREGLVCAPRVVMPAWLGLAFSAAHTPMSSSARAAVTHLKIDLRAPRASGSHPEAGASGYATTNTGVDRRTCTNRRASALATHRADMHAQPLQGTAGGACSAAQIGQRVQTHIT